MYTGKSKAFDPHNALPSVGHYIGPWALYSPVYIRKPVSKKIRMFGRCVDLEYASKINQLNFNFSLQKTVGKRKTNSGYA